MEINKDGFVIVAFAVIDTNVIISSFLGNKETPTKQIMKFVENGNIIPLFDERIIKEYFNVLCRFYDEDTSLGIITEITSQGYLVRDIEKTKEFFKDKSDIPFFEVKESARELEPYLITGNTKDYPENSTKTPAFVVDVLRYLNGFVIRDKEAYLKDIKSITDKLESDEKYLQGKEVNIKRHIRH